VVEPVTRPALRRHRPDRSHSCIFGGTGDRDDLIFWSTLGGDRDEPIWTTDPHGRGRSRTVRSVPVMAPAQIANLPEGRVLVFRRGGSTPSSGVPGWRGIAGTSALTRSPWRTRS